MKKLFLLLIFLAIYFSLPAAVTYSNGITSTTHTVQKLGDKKSIRKHKRALKKELKKELKKIRKAQKHKNNTALLVPLTILLGLVVFAGFSILIFALEYSLGYTGWFILLWLLGLSAIIYGLVKMIKKIKRKKATG